MRAKDRLLTKYPDAVVVREDIQRRQGAIQGTAEAERPQGDRLRQARIVGVGRGLPQARHLAGKI